MRNHMSAGMREKAVFVVAREMVGRQGMYSRPASATAGEAERRAYRLLTLAGFTIVIFTADALAVCAECHEGNSTCDAVRYSTRPTPLSKQIMPLLDATAALHIDLACSWLVGDRLDNIEVGCLLGCNTILCLNGSETDWDMTAMRWPHFIVRDIWETACLIVNAGGTFVASVSDEESDQDD
ncbi:MAG TPA: HAD hydrolase-like protein [Nitrospira sp.]|nr:HAD hydrolase-like protein [Nitrospira sp.]